MTDLVSNETITEITQTFWGAFLPDDGELVPATTLPPTDDISGRVEIDGAWCGSVEVSCSSPVARKIASAMFATADVELTPSDIADAVGELVNVVGGNIKSILPTPTQLSVPAVGGDSEWRFSSELTSEVLLAWSGEPVVVRVWRTRASEQ